MRYENIVISPHIDDAFFSLGSLLTRDRDKKQKIVNVFSRSDFTIQEGHTGRFDRTTTIRKAEEMKNVRRVNADVEFLDYRSGEGKKLAEKLHKGLGRYLKQGRKVFFPLGMIGGHGDHELLYEVGQRFAIRNNNICFYEDLPYYFKTTKLFALVEPFLGKSVSKAKRRSLNRREWEERVIKVKYGSKLALCNAYKSQVDLRIIASIISYGSERVWQKKNRD